MIRSRREAALAEARPDLFPPRLERYPDTLERRIPPGFREASTAERLEAMWGFSLDVGVEVLCWGPLRELDAAQLNLVDRVRHDVMRLCADEAFRRDRARKQVSLEELAERLGKTPGD